ncbi:porin [Sungkyunkwania multivorans]|uniref:Porin n=1 Tax=Sungkyunkwania multivorans TaxID=1173618 RepID=A0ABW3CVR5_9FLAO
MKTITITKIVKKVIFTAVLLVGFTGFSQEEEEPAQKFSLSGSVDAYYRANINSANKTIPDGSGGEIFIAPPTSFANANGFALGMANVIASYEGEKVGFVADLVFGPRGEEAVFGSPVGSTNIVNQLYVYWKVSEVVTLTFGNFNTYLGYEVISPTGNFNYSTSYMFSNGPFSHAGLKADFAIDDNWSAMLSVMNPTDLTADNPESLYTYGAQLGYSTDASSAYLNFLYGKQELGAENTFQVDLTAGSDITDDFYLGFNGTYADTDGDGFYGLALYPQYKTSEAFAIGLRGEYFTVFADGADDDSVFAATLTGSYAVGSLTFKPELRIDSFENEIIPNADLDDVQKSLASFTLAAIYSF